MTKKYILVAVVLFILGISGILQAKMCGSGSAVCPAEAEVVEEAAKEPELVGNTVCPVMGEEIMEDMKAEYEYEGKIYNFCCPACIDEFKKDPQSYIEKLQEQTEEEAS